MAFKFSELKISTPEERAAEDVAYVAGLRAADAANRSQKASKEVSITINEVAARYNELRDQIFTIYGTDASNRRLRAEFTVPSAYGRPVQETIWPSLREGSTHSLKGYWKPYTNREGKTFFTFIAMYVSGIDLDALYTAEVAN